MLNLEVPLPSVAVGNTAETFNCRQKLCKSEKCPLIDLESISIIWQSGLSIFLLQGLNIIFPRPSFSPTVQHGLIAVLRIRALWLPLGQTGSEEALQKVFLGFIIFGSYFVKINQQLRPD